MELDRKDIHLVITLLKNRPGHLYRDLLSVWRFYKKDTWIKLNNEFRILNSINICNLVYKKLKLDQNKVNNIKKVYYN